MNLRAHAFSALFLLSAGAFAAEEKITLRWNVRPEERFEHQIKMVIDGGENGSLTGTMYFAERILSVTDRSIKSSMFVPGLTIVGTGALAAAAPTFEDMRGLKFQRESDFTGKTISLMGMSGLGASTVDLVLPSTEVGVGEKWDSSFVPNPEIGDVKVTYVLESYDRDTATIRADLAESDKLSVVKPYRFVVERVSGRYRSSEGALRMNVSGISLSVSFSQRMLLPHKLRSNGA